MPSRVGFAKTIFENSKQLFKSRSKFPVPHELATTFNVGDIVPLYVSEILPGDTVKIDVAKLIRTSTPIHPTMDDLYFETFWFFTPNRLLWDHWEQFCGASDKAWVDTNANYTIPQIKFDGYILDQETNVPKIEPGSLADYLGIPQGVLTNDNGTDYTLSVSALPFRAYGLIYNYFFRDQNVEDVIPIYTGDNDVIIADQTYGQTVGSDYFNLDNYNYPVYFNCKNSCLTAYKFHDYFTSALPGPLKLAHDVAVPASGYVNVIPQDPAAVSAGVHPTFGTYNSLTGIYTPLDPSYSAGVYSSNVAQTKFNSGDYPHIDKAGVSSPSASAGNLVYDPAGTLGFDNLNITINNLRLAIIVQQWAEKNAISGSRYNEILFSHWGVNAGDSRLQMPEYLGGSMTVLNMGQVVQTSETSSTPLGTLAGNSVTYDNKHEVFKSFVEHGILMCLGVVRTRQTYSQGLECMWNRKTIFDYYDPLFANIGEQPIYAKEAYAFTNMQDAVYGYKEAWSEYKYKPNRVSGVFSPASTGNLASWNYAIQLNHAPVLNKTFLKQSKAEMDRTLAVSSANAPQILASFSFDAEYTRVMNRYNVPGLHRI